MESIYRKYEDIINDIDSDGFITGIIELDFNDLLINTKGIDFINDKVSILLVNEEYSHLLEDISYKLINLNLQKQTVFMEVKAFVNLSETEYKYIYK